MTIYNTIAVPTIGTMAKQVIRKWNNDSKNHSDKRSGRDHDDNDDDDDERRRPPPSKWMRIWGSPKISILLLVLFVTIHRQTAFSIDLLDDKKNNLSGVDDSATRKGKRMSTSDEATTSGAIVILAGQRHAGTYWNNITRFCLLRRAIRSVDENINQHYGPYPIHVVVAKDYDEDPSGQDARYTSEDRSLVASWAPHSPQIIWEEVDLYSGEALEPDTTRDQILEWRRSGGDGGAVKGSSLGYQSMCRLWSGRLQSMKFLDSYDYYMRVDDDSLVTDKPPWDPFQRMVEKSLLYSFKRYAVDTYGIDKLWMVARDYVMANSSMSHKKSRRKFLERFDGPDGSRVEHYVGTQPYNNFHVTKVGFWRSSQWAQLMKDMDEEHLFFKFRVGDANVHAMAIMMMGDDRVETFEEFPYVHNSNDMGKKKWAPPEWKTECDKTESQFHTLTST